MVTKHQSKREKLERWSFEGHKTLHAYHARRGDVRVHKQRQKLLPSMVCYTEKKVERNQK